jgi:hypothetical protein
MTPVGWVATDVMYLERKEFISKGASLATICVTQPRHFCAESPGVALFACLLATFLYKADARAGLYPSAVGIRCPGSDFGTLRPTTSKHAKDTGSRATNPGTGADKKCLP